MRKKKAILTKKKTNAELQEEFRKELTDQIKRIYHSKAKTINFKDSGKAFLLIALKRALSYDWLKEDIRKLREPEQETQAAIHKENKPNDKKTRLRKTKLPPDSEKALIDRFKILKVLCGCTKKEAIEILVKEFHWQSYESLEKHIRRLSSKHGQYHKYPTPDEDQQLEDILMDISELGKALDT
tara:strand:+ start:206 stop:757 length:552 start_codon:yes stop_codon:yes gene_type:complete